MLSLFPVEPAYPPGFAYHHGFLSAAEEQELLVWAAAVATRPSRYGDYAALRRTASFRLGNRGAEEQESAQAPELLTRLAERVARFVGRDASAFPHALLTEYPPGAPMGWHRDAPPWRVIYGVSLGAPCRFFLRPLSADARYASRQALGSLGGAALARPAGDSTLRLTLEPRSLYVIAGPARSVWQHSLPPVKALRYSITLRTM